MFLLYNVNKYKCLKLLNFGNFLGCSKIDSLFFIQVVF